jgi:hypothetical protein
MKCSAPKCQSLWKPLSGINFKRGDIMRFEQRENCYYDTETGLEWFLENHSSMTWQQAVEFCKTLGDGWRLPTIRELLLLVNYEKTGLTTELPKMLSSGYWSCTTYAHNTNYAWNIGYYDGYGYWLNKSCICYVRAVRGGPPRYTA